MMTVVDRYVKIALVVLDTLRKDAFDRHFQWLPGTRFERTFAPSHWTVPVHASLFTGQQPGKLGVHSRQTVLNTEKQTIPERLSAAGFQTIGFSANPQITGQFNFDRGFDVFDVGWRAKPIDGDVFDWKSYISEQPRWKRYLGGLSECLKPRYDTVPSIKHGLKMKRGYRDDGAEESLSFLQKQTFDKDAFVFVNLMEAHGPFRAPESYRRVEPTSIAGLPDTIRGAQYDSEQVQTAYHDCVRYLSDMYKKIFSVFEQADFDLIITCGDHGEMFGEYDGVWQHDYGLYPQLTHVPLALSGKLAEDANSTDALTSLLDIPATIGSITNIEQQFEGESLFASTEHEHLITEYHGIPLQQKYDQLVAEFGKSTVEPYDEPLTGIASADGSYAWQTNNGILPEEIAAIWKDRIHSNTGQLKKEVQSIQSTAVPEQVESTLEDLGYM